MFGPWGEYVHEKVSEAPSMRRGKGGGGSQNKPQICRTAFRLTGSRLMAIRGIWAKRLLGQYM